MVMHDHALAYRLPREPESVRLARRIVSDIVPEADRAVLLDTALLLVSELVGNAVRYGQEPITIDLTHSEHSLVIGVSDAASTMPAVRAYSSATEPGERALEPDDSDSVGGRGLRLIAILSDSWGVEKRIADKRVWFRLHRDR